MVKDYKTFFKHMHVEKDEEETAADQESKTDKPAPKTFDLDELLDETAEEEARIEPEQVRSVAMNKLGLRPSERL